MTKGRPKANVVRKVNKAGKVVVTKPAKGATGKLTDKILKAFGK